jgi:DNA-directed RNA polymerase specialized sigma24 family protein
MVTRIRSGDANAQQEFIDKYKEQICRSIRLRLGGGANQKRGLKQGQADPDSRVESLFNASMIRFLKRLERGVLDIKDEKIVGYVFTISKRIVIDRERRRKTIPMEGGDTDLQLPDTRTTPEYEIETKDLASKVQSLISSLPEADREVAKKVLGFQDNEIGLPDTSSSASLRSKWFRLRKKIKSLLD